MRGHPACLCPLHQHPRTPHQLPRPLSPSAVRSVPDDYRCGKALGPVESLQGHLRDPAKILIGYSRGLLVIWNQAARCAERIFLGNQVCGCGRWPPRASAHSRQAHAYPPPHSSWRACAGSAVATRWSARTVMAATPSGLQTLVTPQRHSPRWPPRPMVSVGNRVRLAVTPNSDWPRWGNFRRDVWKVAGPGQR